MNKSKKKTFSSSKTKAVSQQTVIESNAFAWKKKWLFILFVFSVLLYANTYKNDYAFDDEVAITSNSFTQQGLKGIPDLMTKDFFSGIYGKALDLGGGRYRPLSLVMFAVEHQFFGNNPHPSHLINIILYGFCSIVLFLLLLDFFPEQPLISIAASLLFIAHPLHTEVVANIKSRDEILSFLFLCLTLCYTLKYAKSDLKKYFFYGCIFYFLALFSKENGITFLAIIPLTIYFFTDKTNIKTCLKKSVPFFVTAFIYLALRTYMVGLGAKSSSDIMENPFVNATFFERMATISCISGKYLWMLIFPFPLSSDYSFNQIPIINWTSLKALIPFLIFLFLLIWAIKNAKQKHPVSYGILFFFITYSIVSNVFFNIGAPMGERFLFLPSLGFCIAIAWLLNYFSMKKNPLKNKFSVPITLFISAVLLIFSVETIARNKDWKNNITLFSTDVNTVPNSAKVHYYYGNSILIKALKLPDGEVKTNMLEKSKSEFLKSVEINPKFYTSFYNLGLIFKTENNPDSAIYYLQKVLALSPQHILTQGLLGSIYGKEKGDFDKAILYLKKAVLFNPQDLGSWENLGIAYAMKKNFPDALNAFQHAQQLNPTDAQAYLNIAITYQNMGEKEKASPYFAKAFELNPALKK